MWMKKQEPLIDAVIESNTFERFSYIQNQFSIDDGI